jgi:hypothetical protein
MTIPEKKGWAPLRSWFAGLPFARSTARKPMSVYDLPQRLHRDVGIDQAVIVSALLTR